MHDFSSIDSKIGQHVQSITQAQAAAFEVDGSYVQLLESHSTPPVLGQAKAADRETTPVGRTKGREDLGLVSPTEWSERIDIYESPVGWGYVVTFAVLVSGKRWEKSVNHGPETWRDSDWHEVEVGDESGGGS